MKRINDCRGPGGGWGRANAEETEASSEAVLGAEPATV